MPSQRLIVLKFGGSVLQNEDRLRTAVHEIYRWRREGWNVLAVVSALAGETDGLLHRCDRLCADADAATHAALIANGEMHSAALLGLLLDRAGIPASVASPGGLGLVARGDPLDATPVDIDAAKVKALLDRDGVLVVPGFVGVDALGRPVTFGRGGSDLTALFFAHRLGADRCRLIKDVDGLYTSDPAGSAVKIFRYSSATWQDALGTDGSIVQHKAVRFAQRHGLAFELGSFNSDNPTLIGDDGASLEPRPEPEQPATVALLGFGVVGAGVFDLLLHQPDRFKVIGIAVRDAEKPRGDLRAAPYLSTRAEELASAGADIVIEVIGGADRALPAAQAALAAGSALVTANKALIAEHGADLSDQSRAFGSPIAYAAAVGGACPILECLRSIDLQHVVRVRAICNGTSNDVLTRCGRGESLDDAIAQAQRRGFAERDPSRDLLGLDDADKLRLIAREFGIGLLVDEIEIEAITQQAIESASEPGRVIRRIATLDMHDRSPRASVRLKALDQADPLAAIDHEHNAIECVFADGSTTIVRGRGAGRWPTAEAVLADCLAIVRGDRACDRETEEAACA